VSRSQAVLIVLALVSGAGFLLSQPSTQAARYDEAVCAGPPLRTVQQREEALEAGYVIDPRYGCIERRSFEEVNAQSAAWEQRQAERLAKERAALAEAGQPDLGQSRHGFETKVALPAGDPDPLPRPPSELFVRSDYKNPKNYRLPGFITPDPRDGQRHPAILWLSGGDTNALGDFWIAGPDANDQSARAFREAGVVMIFPTLRGGHGYGGGREWLLGEVDDVLAAAEQAARIRYVDPERLYLGGHSTGGTLALLTAAMRTPFKAVFAFGPVASVERYTPGLIPLDFAKLDPMELKLRSPIHWLEGIGQPTYLIEGVAGQGNRADLEALCAASRNPQVHCLPVPGADHFSVLRPATLAIAAKIAAGEPLGFTAEALAPR
jgi:alpha/beta superfamily hydrolase